MTAHQTPAQRPTPPQAFPPVPDHDAWIQTHSGMPFDLLSPTADHVLTSDIAVALSRAPRFSGHTTRPYSVAQHCLGVAELLRVTGHEPHVILQGLLHDATEAYVVDVPRPLKAMLSEYKTIEDRVWRAIADRYGLEHELDRAVKWADEDMLIHEARLLLPGGPMGWGNETPTTKAPVTLRWACASDHWETEYTRALTALLGQVPT